MESTVKVVINRIMEGYEDKSSPRGWWVYVKIHEVYNGQIWCETYEGLREIVRKKFNMRLPLESELHWYNYGDPYNTAHI